MVAPLTIDQSAEQVAIPTELVDRMCGRLQKVQMLPIIAQQALEVAKDPECSIRAFARIVEQDIKLATEMLRIANSSIYNTGRPIATLPEATMRLGLQQCKNLILTSSFASLIESFTLEEEWIRDLLWRHGLVTAVIAANLNRALRAGFQGEEFTAGLVHDVGRILLAVALPEKFRDADPVNFDESSNPLPAESGILGTNHAEMGAWFAAGNRLPACLVSVVRHHHTPERAVHHRRLVALIAASDQMANYVQRHETAEGYDPTSNAAIDLLEGEGLPDCRKTFEQRASKILEDSCRDALELCGA